MNRRRIPYSSRRHTGDDADAHVNPALIVLAFAIAISAFPLMFSLLPIIDAPWSISLLGMFFAMAPAPCWLGAVLDARASRGKAKVRVKPSTATQPLRHNAAPDPVCRRHRAPRRQRLSPAEVERLSYNQYA